MVGDSVRVLSATSTTKTGHHDTAEILLKVALNTKNQSINPLWENHSLYKAIDKLEKMSRHDHIIVP